MSAFPLQERKFLAILETALHANKNKRTQRHWFRSMLRVTGFLARNAYTIVIRYWYYPSSLSLHNGLLFERKNKIVSSIVQL